jgi:energy-coupling factor transporter transmembrane protein EcfT
MGFVKAFRLFSIPQFTNDISKPLGLLWLLTALLFFITALFLYFKSNVWFMLAFIAVFLSQVLLIIYWQEAKYGALLNILILLIAIVGFATWNFKNKFENDVIHTLESTTYSNDIITEKDLVSLPVNIQKYLRYVGVVGTPKISTMKLTFQGEMREQGKDWFSFTSNQYNFFKNPTRLYFLNANFKGFPTQGYHIYKQDISSMKIKLLSIFTVVYEDRPALFPTETVTYFNELCLFAPGALIDKKIEWEEIDSTSVKAIFRNNSAQISATLYFNEIGQLVNFISEDRYAIADMKKYTFSTPVKDYKKFNGLKLPSYGEAIWHYPEGDFMYGKFYLKTVQYNVNFKK